MPRLQVFVVCEKAIIGQDDGLPTLIGLIDGFGVQVPAGEQVTPNALLPIRTSIFSLWKLEPGDEGKTFEERVRLRYPDGHYGPEQVRSFSFAAPKEGNRHTINNQGFPAQAGEYRVEIALREAGETEWCECGAYPLKITHTVAEPPAN